MLSASPRSPLGTRRRSATNSRISCDSALRCIATPSLRFRSGAAPRAGGCSPLPLVPPRNAQAFRYQFPHSIILPSHHSARPHSLRWARLWYLTAPVDSRIRNPGIRETPAATHQADDSAPRPKEGGHHRPGEAMRRRLACQVLKRPGASVPSPMDLARPALPPRKSAPRQTNFLVKPPCMRFNRVTGRAAAKPALRGRFCSTKTACGFLPTKAAHGSAKLFGSNTWKQDPRRIGDYPDGTFCKASTTNPLPMSKSGAKGPWRAVRGGVFSVAEGSVPFHGVAA